MSAWRYLLAYALGFVVLVGMMFWVAGDTRLGVYLVAGFSVALLAFLLLARLTIRLVATLRGGSEKTSMRLLMPGTASLVHGQAST